MLTVRPLGTGSVGVAATGAAASMMRIPAELLVLSFSGTLLRSSANATIQYEPGDSDTGIATVPRHGPDAPGGSAGMSQYVPENVVTRSSVK